MHVEFLQQALEQSVSEAVARSVRRSPAKSDEGKSLNWQEEGSNSGSWTWSVLSQVVDPDVDVEAAGHAKHWARLEEPTFEL